MASQIGVCDEADSYGEIDVESEVFKQLAIQMQSPNTAKVLSTLERDASTLYIILYELWV